MLAYGNAALLPEGGEYLASLFLSNALAVASGVLVVAAFVVDAYKEAE